MALTMKNAVFWDAMPCKNQHSDVYISSETSVLTRATWRHIPEDGVLYFVNVHTVTSVVKFHISM
jgi:hypothetical protein